MVFWLVLIASGTVLGGACAIVASNKNRDPLGWFALGFCFSIVALIVIASLSPLNKRQQRIAGKTKNDGFVSNPQDPERPWLG